MFNSVRRRRRRRHWFLGCGLRWWLGRCHMVGHVDRCEVVIVGWWCAMCCVVVSVVACVFYVLEV